MVRRAVPCDSYIVLLVAAEDGATAAELRVACVGDHAPQSAGHGGGVTALDPDGAEVRVPMAWHDRRARPASCRMCVRLGSHVECTRRTLEGHCCCGQWVAGGRV